MNVKIDPPEGGLERTSIVKNRPDTYRIQRESGKNTRPDQLLLKRKVTNILKNLSSRDVAWILDQIGITKKNNLRALSVFAVQKFLSLMEMGMRLKKQGLLDE